MTNLETMLSELLGASPEDADRIARALPDADRFRLGAALRYLRRASSPFDVFFFLESLVAAKQRGKCAFLTRLFLDHASTEHKLEFVEGWAFTRPYRFGEPVPHPVRHVMYEECLADVDWIRDNWGPGDGSSDCTPGGLGCPCGKWLRGKLAALDRALEAVIGHLCDMRHSLVHESWPVFMVAETPPPPSNGSTILDLYPCDRNDPQLFRTYEAGITFDRFKAISTATARAYLLAASGPPPHDAGVAAPETRPTEQASAGPVPPGPRSEPDEPASVATVAQEKPPKSKGRARRLWRWMGRAVPGFTLLLVIEAEIRGCVQHWADTKERRAADSLALGIGAKTLEAVERNAETSGLQATVEDSVRRAEADAEEVRRRAAALAAQRKEDERRGLVAALDAEIGLRLAIFADSLGAIGMGLAEDRGQRDRARGVLETFLRSRDPSSPGVERMLTYDLIEYVARIDNDPSCWRLARYIEAMTNPGRISPFGVGWPFMPPDSLRVAVQEPYTGVMHWRAMADVLRNLSLDRWTGDSVRRVARRSRD